MIVLILIFLENALRPQEQLGLTVKKPISLNPYFFGKCSTAVLQKRWHPRLELKS